MGSAFPRSPRVHKGGLLAYRLPEDRLPDQYGVEDQAAFPREMAGQLAYPFRK